MSNAEYIANESIVIIPGGSLTIGKNATIAFASECSIYIKRGGQLVTDGAVLKAQMNNMWRGIVLETLADTQINSTLLTDAFTGVHVRSTGNLNISNSIFENMTSHVINLETPSELSDAARRQMISLSNIVTSKTNHELTESHGIYAPHFQGTLKLSTSSMNGYGIYARNEQNWYGPDMNVILLDNSITTTGNDSTAVSISNPKMAMVKSNIISCMHQCLQVLSDRDAFIESNTFKGVQNDYFSDEAQVYVVWNGATNAASFSMQNNTLTSWRTSNHALIVQIAPSAGLSANGPINLEGNSFEDITAATIFRLMFYRAHRYVNIANTFKSKMNATAAMYPSAFYISKWPR